MIPVPVFVMVGSGVVCFLSEWPKPLGRKRSERRPPGNIPGVEGFVPDSLWMGNKVENKDPVFFVQNDKIRFFGICQRYDVDLRDDRAGSFVSGMVERGIDRSGFIVPSLGMIYPDLPEGGRGKVDGCWQFDISGGVEGHGDYLKRLAPR